MQVQNTVKETEGCYRTKVTMAQSSKTETGEDVEAANKVKMEGFVLEQKELLKK